MKVLFIRPKPLGYTIGLQHIMIVEPLELEILATLIQIEHEVRIVDMILEKYDFDFFIREYDPDIICVTGYITHIPVIIEYCVRAKRIKRKIVSIVGGVHVEKFPADLNHSSIDFRVIRNATRSFPQLIDFLDGKSDFPDGVLKTNQFPDEAKLPDYDFYVPIPDRTLTSKYRNKYYYVFHDKVALLKTSFGCPYGCKFCFCRIITGDKYFARPLDEVFEELTSIKEKEIYIVDDDFLICPSRVREFINLLKRNKITKKFLVYGRADFIVKYPDLIKEFKDAGLRTVIVGLESFEDLELKEYNKQTTSSINIQAMEVLHKNKVDCYAAVIIPPSWGSDDFRKAESVMKEIGIKFINLQPLTPLMGTGLEVNENDLVITRRDYSKWDLAHVTIRPEKMTLEDFYRHIYNLYMRIILYPKNILSNFKYPLHMQIRLIRGMNRVRKQYRDKIIEVSENV